MWAASDMQICIQDRRKLQGAQREGKQSRGGSVMANCTAALSLSPPPLGKDYTSCLIDIRLGHSACSEQLNVNKSDLCNFQVEAIRAYTCFPTISTFPSASK